MPYVMNYLGAPPNKVLTRKNSSFRRIELVGDPLLKNLQPVDPSLKLDDNGRPMPGYFNGNSYYLIDGRPLDPATVPTRAVLDHKPEAEIPYCMIECAQIWYVCDAFKDIIEELEPGVHQFFRIDMVWKNGTSAGHRYLLNVCNRVAYTDEARSDLISCGSGYGVSQGGKVYVFPDAVAGKALWRERTFHSWQPWISDEAVARIEAAGLKGAKFQHATIAPDGLRTFD